MLVAVAYAAIGIVFARLAVDANHVRVWRLAAWLASAVVAAAHIWYEQYRLGSSPRPTALHAAGAVALGALGLALAPNLPWLFSGAHRQRPPLLPPPARPVVTG